VCREDREGLESPHALRSRGSLRSSPSLRSGCGPYFAVLPGERGPFPSPPRRAGSPVERRRGAHGRRRATGPDDDTGTRPATRVVSRPGRASRPADHRRRRPESHDDGLADSGPQRKPSAPRRRPGGRVTGWDFGRGRALASRDDVSTAGEGANAVSDRAEERSESQAARDSVPRAAGQSPATTRARGLPGACGAVKRQSAVQGGFRGPALPSSVPLHRRTRNERDPKNDYPGLPLGDEERAMREHVTQTRTRTRTRTLGRRGDGAVLAREVVPR
jgi:hypothetical protein